MSRRRLPPDERRSQLIDVGARLFAGRPYHEVQMAQVASAAGVSRALVYRYFPSKRDLFAAIYRQAADELVEVTGTRPPGAVDEWVSAGLDAHFDYFAAHATTVLAANRDLAGDPMIQSIITGELAALRGRLLDALDLSGHRREMVAVALLAWLSFVRVSSVEWLLHGQISRDELHTVCMRTLAAALVQP